MAKGNEEQPKERSLEERLESLVGDQLTRYTESAKQDVALLYLIHCDLKQLVYLLREGKADSERKKAGF